MLKKLLLFIGDALDHLLYVLGPTVRWMLWGVAIALVILMYLETR